MKTAIIKIFGVLLLLSFMLVAMPAIPAQATDGLDLKIHAPYKVYVCEEFEVSATVCNCGSEVAEDVEVELELEEDCNLELAGECEESQWVGDVWPRAPWFLRESGQWRSGDLRKRNRSGLQAERRDNQSL